MVMQIKQIICIWFIVLMGIPLGVSIADAKEEKVYTLNESITEALTNNWSIKAKKESIETARYVKKQAKADFLPKLSTSYGYTRDSEVRLFRSTLPGTANAALSTRHNFRWTNSLSQPLFTGFALSSAYELAKFGIDLSEMDLALEKLDLALQVKENYFNILKMDKAVEVAKKEVEGLASHLKVTRSFYEVGMRPINDLLKSEVELANAQHDLVRAEIAAKLARSSFNTVLSKHIDAPVEVEDIIAYESEAGDFSDFVERSLKNRPEIKTLDINMLQTEQQMRQAASKYYPEVALTYDYIKEGDQLDVQGSDFHDAGYWQVQTVLSWTFWEWGKTRSAVSEKRSLRRELMKMRRALEDGIRLQIKQAILDIEQEGKNIPTARKAVEQGEENLRVSQERYKAQVTTSTEVLDAQTLLTQARVNYYSALYDQNLAKARLLRAIGEY